MVIKKKILRTLNGLEQRYIESLKTPTSEDSVYFSKLAILEYCGWIEESFDDIVRRSVKGKIKTPKFQQILKKKVIGKNNGFQYDDNFLPMLSRAIGLRGMEIIEIYLKRSGQLELFISELNSIKEHRNNAAHTCISGATPSYPAPSIIKANFKKIFPIMTGIYKEVIKL